MVCVVLMAFSIGIQWLITGGELVSRVTLLALSILGLLSLSTACATAQYSPFQANTGADLLHQCQKATIEKGMTESDVADLSYCVGFLRGMTTAFDFWRFAHSKAVKNTPPACLAEGATNQELALVIVHYLNEHPTKLHEPYANVAIEALRDAYPCAAPAPE